MMEQYRERLQPNLGIKQLESAFVERGKCWIEHEGCLRPACHRRGVSSDGGKIGKQRKKAVDVQTIVGALGCRLLLAASNRTAPATIERRAANAAGLS